MFAVSYLWFWEMNSTVPATMQSGGWQTAGKLWRKDNVVFFPSLLQPKTFLKSILRTNTPINNQTWSRRDGSMVKVLNLIPSNTTIYNRFWCLIWCCRSTGRHSTYLHKIHKSLNKSLRPGNLLIYFNSYSQWAKKKNSTSPPGHPGSWHRQLYKIVKLCGKDPHVLVTLSDLIRQSRL